jgi:hypothetical protein
VDGASNAFASALWALDYLHWHAEHHAAGVNFHNKSWIYTDTVYRGPDGTFGFNPKAYAIEAFDAGSRGSAVPVSIRNEHDVNLTAYAVRGDHELFVTLINKEHGPAAQTAAVSIEANGIAGRAAGMFLRAPGGEVTARDGITFGGAAISREGWQGRWSELELCKDGRTNVDVPPASAVVVKLALK